MRIPIALSLFLPLLIAFPVQGQERPGPARAEMESRIETLHRELESLHSAREQLQRERHEQNPSPRIELRRRERQALEMEREREDLQIAIVENQNRLNSISQRHQERPEMAEAHRRLEHLAAARKHLMEAGSKEMADQVGEQIEQLERRMQNQRRDRPVADRGATTNEDPFRREVLGAINELNRALDQLREEVQRIRRDSDDRQQ